MKFPVQGRPAKQNPTAARKHSKMGSQEHLYLTQVDLNLSVEVSVRVMAKVICMSLLPFTN